MDSQDSQERSRWPGSSILIWGTFGSQTPEGRRYHNRCLLALFGLAAGSAAFTLARDVPGARLAASFLPGVAFAWIAWEFRVYLLSLDELARRMQMEAVTWTYLLGLVAAMGASGIVMAFDIQWRLSPLWYLSLEPLRAAILYRIARRY